MSGFLSATVWKLSITPFETEHVSTCGERNDYMENLEEIEARHLSLCDLWEKCDLSP